MILVAIGLCFMVGGLMSLEIPRDPRNGIILCGVAFSAGVACMVVAGLIALCGLVF